MPLYYSTHIWNCFLCKIVSHLFDSSWMIMVTKVYCMPAWIVLVHNFCNIPPPCGVCWKTWRSVPRLNAILLFKWRSMYIHSLNHLHPFHSAPPSKCWHWLKFIDWLIDSSFDISSRKYFLSGPAFPWSEFQTRAKKRIHHIFSSVVVQNCSSFFSAQLPVQVMKVILSSIPQYYWHLQHQILICFKYLRCRPISVIRAFILAVPVMLQRNRTVIM
jgi:hypothetical protein